MTEYELDITAEDIGDAISMIRIQCLRLHVRPFADKIGVKEKVVLMTEEGNGPHGLLILKKINETFKDVEITINVKIK